MKEEILAAVMFLIRFIEKSDTFPGDQIENFKNHLTALLTQRFEKHWFPEVPAKGQGYRCIRVNGLTPVDFTLERAASKCGLNYSDLRLPAELTVWVDPNEVCYRLGESEGSYCTLATFSSSETSSTSSSSFVSSSSLSSLTSSSSESSTPSPSPPTTPLQDKQRRVPNKTIRAYADGAIKHRNYNMNVAAFRVKPPTREPSISSSEDTACTTARQTCFTTAQATIVPAKSLAMRRLHRPVVGVYARYSFAVHTHGVPYTSQLAQLSFNSFQNRTPWRCDGPPYPFPPMYSRNMNYNTRHFKNILRV